MTPHLREPIANPLMAIMYGLYLLLTLLYFVGPIISIVTAIICSIIFVIVVKRFRKENNIIIQVVCYLTMFLLPFAFFYKPIEDFSSLFFQYWRTALKEPDFAGPFVLAFLECVPVLAFMIFFNFWMILYVFRVIKVFPKPYFGAIAIVAQTVLSIVFIAIFAVMKWLAPTLSLMLLPPEGAFELQTIPLIILGVDAFITFIVEAVGTIIYFIPFIVVVIFAFRAKKLDKIALIIVIQACVAIGLLFFLANAGGKALDFVITLLDALILLLASTTFRNIDYFAMAGLALPVLHGLVKVLVWFLIILAVALETFAIFFVYGQMLGNVFVHEISKTEISRLPNEQNGNQSTRVPSMNEINDELGGNDVQF